MVQGVLKELFIQKNLRDWFHTSVTTNKCNSSVLNEGKRIHDYNSPTYFAGLFTSYGRSSRVTDFKDFLLVSWGKEFVSWPTIERVEVWQNFLAGRSLCVYKQTFKQHAFTSWVKRFDI